MPQLSYDEVFLRAIREAPDDDTAYLVYADWLEEHGRAERAEFIRIQCRLDRPDEPDVVRLTARAEALLHDNWAEWVGPLREMVGPMHDRYGESWLREEYHPDALARFRRGFVDRLTLDAERFIIHAEKLARLVPLRVLNLWGAGRCADELAECPQLAGLEVLGFGDYWDAPLMAHDARALAASPHLHGLRALHLGWNSLGDEGVAALVRAPWLASLALLDLTENGITDAGASALAGCPRLARLRALFLTRNPISDRGWDVLSGSPYLRQLGRLDVD